VGLTEWIAAFGMQVIGGIGYAGVFLLMVAESMVLPVPSEAVMPFAGFLVAEGTLSPVWAVAAASLGSIVGSLISYAIGRFGGKPFLNRYGRYLLLDAADLEATDTFFRRRGGITIFVARFIPIVRHLISIPAGMASMPLAPFALFTIAGAGMWNAFLTLCGFLLRKNWHTILRYSHVIDIAIVILLLVLIALYVARHLVRRKRAAESKGK
jgi:membrane protein DedA with SNARE-associated domain